MELSDLEVGKVYRVAGYGAMRLVSLPNPPKQRTIRMEKPGGTNFWCSAKDITREAAVGEWELDQQWARGELDFDDYRVKLAALYE